MIVDLRYFEPAHFRNAFGLFYDPQINKFRDEDWFIVWDIFEIITPNDLYLFLSRKEYMLVHHRNFKELAVELYYMEEN